MYIIICVLLTLYFLPLMIAVVRRHPEISQIALINLFLGWSIMFWVVSFRHAVGLDSLELNERTEKNNGEKHAN